MKIRDLLDKPEKWTKKREARSADGLPTSALNEDAVAYSVYGAIKRCYQKDQFEAIYRKIYDTVGHVTHWNDDPATTFEEVRQLVNELDV